MTWLTGLSGPELLALCVVGALFFAFGSLAFLVIAIRPQRREGAGATAVAYMTVLGSLFAILTGFLINSEYTTMRQAQNLVGVEMAGASQLAYASASLPPADTGLRFYLGYKPVIISVMNSPADIIVVLSLTIHHAASGGFFRVALNSSIGLEGLGNR